MTSQETPSSSFREIKLISADGKEFPIDESHALISELIKTSLETDPTTTEIPIPGVKADTLKYIVEFMKHDKDKWNHQFIENFNEKNIGELINLIKGINYFDIKELLDLASIRLSEIINQNKIHGNQSLFKLLAPPGDIKESEEDIKKMSFDDLITRTLELNGLSTALINYIKKPILHPKKYLIFSSLAGIHIIDRYNDRVFAYGDNSHNKLGIDSDQITEIPSLHKLNIIDVKYGRDGFPSIFISKNGDCYSTTSTFNKSDTKINAIFKMHGFDNIKDLEIVNQSSDFCDFVVLGSNGILYLVSLTNGTVEFEQFIEMNEKIVKFKVFEQNDTGPQWIYFLTESGKTYYSDDPLQIGGENKPDMRNIEYYTFSEDKLQSVDSSNVIIKDISKVNDHLLLWDTNGQIYGLNVLLNDRHAFKLQFPSEINVLKISDYGTLFINHRRGIVDEFCVLSNDGSIWSDMNLIAKPNLGIINLRKIVDDHFYVDLTMAPYKFGVKYTYYDLIAIDKDGFLLTKAVDYTNKFKFKKLVKEKGEIRIYDIRDSLKPAKQIGGLSNINPYNPYIHKYKKYKQKYLQFKAKPSTI